MSRHRFPLLAGSLALVALAGILLIPGPQDASVHPPEAAVTSEGLRVAFDPETGDMIPFKAVPLSAKELRSLNRSHDGLTQLHHPDGSASVDLEGRFQCYATATVNSEGKVQLNYAHGTELTPPSPAKKIEE